MDFKKMLSEKRITIPTHQLAGDVEQSGGVIAWSGWVLVRDCKQEDQNSFGLQPTKLITQE
ncbi:hypothetical protein [Bacillus sp. C28GYM-DRY-1]|uniref:hypothetical protein n=1 Tax=Bacillus sp. C28GYM-DRY-1 TaxID=3062686 RepID=UPI00267596CE|nr:hypothetical protein [Bacillus sp. C28GYM-DRY-1]MDO3662403.1 hypothetical protein [Bacillus sp. C28GYM-DRY-1]